MRSIKLGRREFITLIGGAAATWPIRARAQQGTRMPRVGVLFAARKDTSGRFFEILTESLSTLGWIDGKNVRIDYRFAENDVGKAQAFAKELVDLKPDVILAHNTVVVAALQRETKQIPIVFVSVADPVASGFVQSLSHPGGNITGFSNFEPTLVGKYIEILKEISPNITTVSEMFYPDTYVTRPTNIRPILEAAARYHAVKLIAAPVRNDSDFERAISSFGDKGTMGLIIAGDPFFASEHNLNLINSLTVRYRVPAIFPFRFSVEGGGLLSYGNDLSQQFRQAPTYIDRILKGANPADLPVQAPTKFDLVINLKTAKAMALTIPPTLLARADEVIE